MMDIIKCLTCNTPDTEWTHGMFPDVGGAAAHAHQQQYPDHDVRTGNADQLATMPARAIAVPCPHCGRNG